MSVNRMVMVDIPGFSLDVETRAHLTRYKPGGIILFRKNIVDRAQAKALIEDLKSILGDDLLLAIDAEGGGVWRTTDLPNAPSAMGLGAADDLDLAREIGAMVARGLRSMGINWNFAPVLDLNRPVQLVSPAHHDHLQSKTSPRSPPQETTTIPPSQTSGSA